MAAKRPPDEWDDPPGPVEFREVFRYTKDDAAEIYTMRILGDAAELWRITERGGAIETSRRVYIFNDPDEALTFLHELEERLKTDGWTEFQ